MNKTRKKTISILGVAMFTLAAAFYFYEFLLQVSPAIMAPTLMSVFHINAGVLGLISGLYFYSYTIMQIPSGLLYDRLGPRQVITMAAIICAIGALLFGLSSSALMAGVARFLMGIGSACAYLGVLSVSMRWLPRRYFALSAGLAQTLGSLGAAMGQAPLAAVINHIGWRETIILLGVLGLILAGVVGLFLRDRQHKEKTAPQRGYLKQDLQAIFKRRQTWIVALYSLFVWTPVPIFASLWGVPFLMVKYHINNVSAGSLCSMVWVGTAIGGPLSGYISLVMRRRCFPLMLFAALGLMSSLFVVYMNSLPIGVAYILLICVGTASGAQALAFGVVRDKVSDNLANTAMGFNNMAVVLGGAIFQPVVGAILDYYWHGHLEHGARIFSLHAYHVGLLFLPACFFIAIIMAKFFIKETQCQSVSG